MTALQLVQGCCAPIGYGKRGKNPSALVYKVCTHVLSTRKNIDMCNDNPIALLAMCDGERSFKTGYVQRWSDRSAIVRSLYSQRY